MGIVVQQRDHHHPAQAVGHRQGQDRHVRPGDVHYQPRQRGSHEVAHQRPGGLPPVDRAHRSVAEILPVDNQIPGPFTPEPQPETGGEQVKHPRLRRPEHNDRNRQPLDRQRHRHHPPRTVDFRQHRGSETADNAHQRDDRQDNPRRRQRVRPGEHPRINGVLGNINQDDAMPGAAQSVNQRQVPERPGAADVPVKHFHPQPLQPLLQPGRNRIPRTRPIGFNPHIGRPVAHQRHHAEHRQPAH